MTQVKVNGATPSAVAATVRYDADGGAIPTTMPTTLYSYNAVGDLTQDSEPDGISTDYTYDGDNQLTDEFAINTTTNEPVFREHYDLDSNGDGLKQDEIDTNYSASGGVVSKIEYNWTYDAEQRLTEEELTVLSGSGANVPTPYTDVFTYDQANNRTEEDINGGDSISGGQSIRYVYNNDDQLTAETETAYSSPGNTTQTYQTTYTFDGNGNLSTENRTGTEATSNTYTYDIRNRMITAVINGTTTTYGYDTNGVLIGETTGSTSTYYLNDPNNPTGYTKAIQESAMIGGAPTRSYVLGSKVEAQSDSNNGTLYLVTDGHGSTRALVNSAGTVAERYDYDAYGVMILGQHINSTGTMTTVTAVTAATQWLFAGDGKYDPATGWTYHLARWDNGFWFTTSDFGGYGSSGDPISLHKYLYANADPTNMWDPSGHEGLGELLAVTGIDTMLSNLEFGAFSAVAKAVNGVQAGENADQIFKSFLIDQAIGIGIGLGAGLLASGVGALRNGISLDFNLFSKLDEFLPEAEATASETTEIGEVASPGSQNFTLDNEFPGIRGEYLGDSRPTFKELADLSRKNNVEYVLVYKVPSGSTSAGGGGGTYTLYSGSQNGARFPIDENTRLIVHTHPGGTLGPSQQDIDVLLNLQGLGSPQQSSQIIAVGDQSFQTIRYNSSSTPLP